MRQVVVIGGGLAGAAAATHLAGSGHDVCLIERSAGPHDKVCGEFLSYEAQEDLAGLGLDLVDLGAVPIRRVAVHHGASRSELPLPFEALSLSRRILDEALLGRAATAGVEVRRGRRVTGATRKGAGWEVSLERDGTLRAHHLLLATGKHDLRGWKRPAGRQSDLLGFKTYWRLADAGTLAGTVELHLFPGGYAGLELVDGGRANLCLVIRRAVVSSLAGRWEGILSHVLANCPRLEAHLAGATSCTSKPLAIAAIPYGLLQERSDGVWRLGDQAAVIPSFTGEGMSIALHSARLGSSFLAAGRSPEEFQRRLASSLQTQVRRSTLLSRGLIAPVPQALLTRLLTPSLFRWGLRQTRIAETARRHLLQDSVEGVRVGQG